MKIAKNLLLFILIITLSNCYSQKKNKIGKNYIITKFKSKNKSSCYLNLEAYDYENKKEKYYSVYRINNLIFSEHNLNSLTFHVLPGNFEIECGMIGKESIRLKDFEIKRGDSINIRFYLKDSDEVFDEHPVIKN